MPFTATQMFALIALAVIFAGVLIEGRYGSRRPSRHTGSTTHYFVGGGDSGSHCGSDGGGCN